MQKKLIALAIAGLSSAAFAQSNVTVYGVIDTTWESMSASGATAADAAATGNIASRSRLSTNSSNIGFKGAESLGNGLTAVFQAEVTLSPVGDKGNATAGVGSSMNNSTATTTAGLFSGIRDTYVGVAGGFGTVVMGTLTHPLREMGAKVDFNPGASSSGFVGSMYGEFLGVKTGTDDRASGAIAYVTPTFSGFTGVVAYVNKNNALTGAQNANIGNQVSINAKDPQVFGSVLNQFGLALGAGPLVGAATTYNDELKAWRFATTYAFPTNTTVGFLYDNQKYTTSASNVAALNTNAKRTAWALTGKQTMGQNDFWIEYATANAPTGDMITVATGATAAGFCSAGSAAGTCASGDFKAKQWTVGYAYNLSKRTAVHAFYTAITNNGGAAYDNYVNGTGLQGGAAGTSGNRGADPKVYGVGLRHSF